jgi:hypothetical protein
MSGANSVVPEQSPLTEVVPGVFVGTSKNLDVLRDHNIGILIECHGDTTISEVKRGGIRHVQTIPYDSNFLIDDLDTIIGSIFQCNSLKGLNTLVYNGERTRDEGSRAYTIAYAYNIQCHPT